jgi:carbamoyltransferase
LENTSVEELYIVHAAHDAGGAIGAAFYYAAQQGEVVEIEQSPYLGPSFTDSDIADTLRNYGLSYHEPEDVTEYTSAQLLEGKIVGWMHGAMEMGSRALGNRSVLALPNRLDVRDKVNRIKGRELWRPLSPSILDTDAQRLVTHPHSPYMLLALQTTEYAQSVMPATIHVDGTCRPQTVSKTMNYPFWSLLNSIKAQTGTGCLLNTSLNLDREPIVCTPTDAIRLFFSSELDMLILGGFVLEK